MSGWDPAGSVINWPPDPDSGSLLFYQNLRKKFNVKELEIIFSSIIRILQVDGEM